MKVQKVGSRGLVFTFEDPYKLNLYVILGDNHTFLCDTGFGSDSINSIIDYMKKESIDSQPFIVFNSHADYDHVWGNHMFKNSLIIAHEGAPAIFTEEGEEMLKNYVAHKKGEVILTPPNCLFKQNIHFIDEGIEFYHSPGHTLESASCYDLRDKVLFVGDNIESPFPYINFLNFDDYIASLKEYMVRDVEIVISGHDEVMFNKALIETNLEYIQNFMKGKVDRSYFTKQHRGIHFMNLTRVGEMFKKDDNKDKSKKHYKEALEILEGLEEKKPEIEEKIEEIKNILKELA